jgi:inhibitor of KinA sporulation pathway (predicted exonuclease)
MKHDRNILVVDVESSCWDKDQPKNEISEIIEIGIAVVNIDKLEITNNSTIIVKPQRSKISKFCTDLTTLTQDQVDQGITFQEATNLLLTEYNSKNRIFVSWGDYDRKMFENNSRDYNVKYPFGPRHLNLKNLFALANGLEKEVGMLFLKTFLLEAVISQSTWGQKL